MAQECAVMLSEYKRADSDSPPTIRDATDYLIAHLKASQRSITATALADQIIDEKKADGMSVRYVQDLRSRLPRFAKKFDGQMESSGGYERALVRALVRAQIKVSLVPANRTTRSAHSTADQSIARALYQSRKADGDKWSGCAHSRLAPGADA